MAKVFTITEGLQNLGALKSGGQGSVYKARKTGEIITAIKILPTPISSETDDDKNFTSFQNEVQKLKKVNESANPNVVSIIASGITTTGNLPYIEMEYIEGPDLGELLKPPYDPIFTIKEVIKVSDHLSNALAHCHRADVKHGDIKSNNVKFNQRTGNYILLDFGLSIMSDEQRRTSIRHAGAIEFMAPEQNTGEMLFETDIYSFGIIVFELLAGTVPFPLNHRGGIARNNIMLAHMESHPPDIYALRRMAMPDSWSTEKKAREMQLPGWLIKMVYKCLEKEPARRFRNGIELLEFIHSGIIAEENRKSINVPLVESTTSMNDEFELKKRILKLEHVVAEKESVINEFQEEVQVKDKELYQYRYAEDHNDSKSSGVSKGVFMLVFTIAIGLAGYT
ncbi:MAG: serine/threonine-protein kinase, partial [Ferruginibacter sp.]